MSARHILGLEKVPRLGCSPIKVARELVQNVVRQFGLYLSWAHEICVALTLVREDRVGLTSGLPVVPPGALPGI